MKSEILYKIDNLDFPIIGIGASAGGLEALEKFFQNMPEDNGMAFIVIQHLDPEHVSMMPELIQRDTTMNVLQASDCLTIKPNHIYVIPPNKSMSILNGALHLTKAIELHGLKLPIDYFFRSLAKEKLAKSIGIILSGMGSDGAQGLKAIKENNGRVLVQDPKDAKFDGMPQSAINTVNVDIVAPVKEIPKKLIDLIKHQSIVIVDYKKDIKSQIGKIISLLHTQTGHDFSLYKKSTLSRRIERRMTAHQIVKIATYIQFLQHNPKEIELLFKEFLIGVTSFFRDTSVWNNLKDNIFPDLFRELADGHVLRAWVTACSTGEEALSLAIVFKEALENQKNKSNLSLQIFATDIDSDAIEIARKGIFSEKIVADVSPERLHKFFAKTEEGFRVNTSIREMIVFAPHNVIKDPPFTKLDFISCRNLLIYMEPELQKKLMELFHYSLNRHGIMLLGSAEYDNSQHTIFKPLDTKLKFYKSSTNAVTSKLLNFPSSFTHQKLQKKIAVKNIKTTNNLETLADKFLLQHYVPASVLINEQGDILHITGHTGKYLEPAAGKVNMNIYAMAREGLSEPLIDAIRKAKQNDGPIILHNVKIGNNKAPQHVEISVQHIKKPNAIKGTFMLVFTEVKPIKRTKEITTKTGKGTTKTNPTKIEIELQDTYTELQTIREEMQTSQEELKSANEELQSTNEELQSTNEELTTSKEEMQSLNEEIQIVNVEMQHKITDFVQANNDMENLLNSTDIATLFLDKELNIRRFTNQVKKIIKLRPSDIGRPFTEMVSDLQYPEIESNAKEVIETLNFIEKDVLASNSRSFTVRIMPYHTFDNLIDGLVITFIDISLAKKLEENLNKTIAVLRKNNLM